MDRTAKERMIALIAWGRVVTVGRLADGATCRFILRPPTTEENARAAIAYEVALQEATGLKMLSETEALKFHETTGQWTRKDEEQLRGLRGDIHKMKRGLLDYLFQVEQLERIRATIRRAEKALAEKWSQKESLLQETAEHFAAMTRQRYIIGRITETNDGKPFWASEEAFNAWTDVSLVQHLVTFYFATSRPSEGTIREIARTEPWRSLWTAGQTTGQVFADSPHAWSYAQSELARWSNLYDIVYDAYERPSDQVVEDDDLLDSWLIRQTEKAADQNRKRESENLLGAIQAKGKGRQEVFVVADVEGAKRVYDLNDVQGRRIVRATQKVAAERGVALETELPHSQAEMREIAVGLLRKTVTQR